jgi:hypothetical protein
MTCARLPPTFDRASPSKQPADHSEVPLLLDDVVLLEDGRTALEVAQDVAQRFTQAAADWA